jgi:hypothetical protein
VKTLGGPWAHGLLFSGRWRLVFDPHSRNRREQKFKGMFCCSCVRIRKERAPPGVVKSELTDGHITLGLTENPERKDH